MVVKSKTKPMKIVMFDTDPGYGHARYVHELLRAMNELEDEFGVETSLVTVKNLSPEYRTGKYKISDILPPLRSRDEFSYRRRWLYYLASHYNDCAKAFSQFLSEHPEIDGIHIQNYPIWRAPLDFSRYRRSQRMVFATVHNVRPHKPLPFMPMPVSDYLNRKSWRHCSGLMVHSERLGNDLRSFLGRASPEIFITPHGTWDVEPAIQPLTHQLGEVDQHHLLAFGIIRRNKGFVELVQAMRHLPEFTLTIAGECRDDQYLSEILREAEAFEPGRVKVALGYQSPEQMRSYFEASTIVVLPYAEFASQSGVLFDAISFGRPVVVTDVGSLGETVRALKIGAVALPRSPEALVRAVRELTEPRNFSRACSAVGVARELATWEVTARGTLGAYLSLLEGDS